MYHCDCWSKVLDCNIQTLLLSHSLTQHELAVALGARQAGAALQVAHICHARLSSVAAHLFSVGEHHASQERRHDDQDKGNSRQDLHGLRLTDVCCKDVKVLVVAIGCYAADEEQQQ